MKKKIKILFVYLLTLSGIFIWIGAIFLAPYLRSCSSSLNIFIYSIFSPLCHQNPLRSFFFLGYPLAVCARCLGIYFGFFAGTGLYPFLKGFSNLALPKTQTFIFLSTPIVIDTLGNFLHLWMTSNWIRFILGFIWGAILPFYFIAGLADYFVRPKRPREIQT